jgi:phosphate/sulfate permease
MISPLFSHLLIPFLIGIFLAINMGGSGTAPSFSAAYGANIIRRTAIPGFFGIMVFAGALIAGKATATTVGRELLPVNMMSFSLVSIILFSVAISLLFANLLGIPQSTSQATILSVTGPAVYFKVLNEQKLLLEIIPAWFILPVFSFVLCFIIGKYLYTPLRKKGYFTFVGISRHPVIRILIVIMSAYVAFAIGANNVANASGPIACMTINELNLKDEADNFVLIMILATLIVAPSFGIGSSIFGHKLLKKTGKGIFIFGPVEAIIISFITASLLLIASIIKGIPSSLVQVNTTSIIGIGAARLGFRNILKKTSTKSFFLVWLIAPLLAFLISIVLTYLGDKTNILSLY